MKYYNLEYHPNDSRIKISDDDICQALTGRMGTGGVMYRLYYSSNPDGRRAEMIMRLG